MLYMSFLMFFTYLYTNVLYVFPDVLIPTSIPMFYMSFLMFWSRRIYQCSICLSWFFNPYLYQSSICLSRCFDHYLYTNVLYVFPGALIPTSIPKFNMSFPVFGSLLSQLVQFKTYKWIITWTARIFPDGLIPTSIPMFYMSFLMV